IMKVFLVEPERAIAALRLTDPLELLDGDIDAVPGQAAERGFDALLVGKNPDASQVVAGRVEERSIRACGVGEDRLLDHGDEEIGAAGQTRSNGPGAVGREGIVQ